MMKNPLKQIDAKEFELPETVFIRDIESRVFQSIAAQCITHIDDVFLIEGNLFDNLLGRDSLEAVKGIEVEQDAKNHAVSVKVEVNISYGVCIPDKSEEIQSKIAQDISNLTGLHVSSVHVIFKDVLPKNPSK